MTPDAPAIVDGAELDRLLQDPDVVVVDVGKADLYARLHLPGARFLDYGHLVTGHGLTSGLMAPVKQLSALFAGLGITRSSRVVAYDEEGGGKAARLCWTLDCLGHHRWSLLNGGIQAWLDDARPLSQAIPAPARTNFVPWPKEGYSADAAYILERLGDKDTALLDARSPAEFRGEQRFARRPGHIPGATNWEWTSALDRPRSLRLRPVADLLGELTARNVIPEREVICYCQTHHRSSLSYVVLRHLGFKRVRGYPGSWSEWGNRLDTPVEN